MVAVKVSVGVLEFYGDIGEINICRTPCKEVSLPTG